MSGDQTSHSGRSTGLDILRSIALLLVIGRHVDYHEWKNAFFDGWFRGGWTGVDLFFALSGFLVSGLLFREYRRSGTILVKRFLLRRGLKIYPAFYFFILVTALVSPWLQPPYPSASWVAELLFVQNYIPGIWPHTWSLGVEEHFYILIALAMFLSLRVWPIAGIKILSLVIVPVVIAGCLALRLWVPDSEHWWVRFSTHVYPTHMRADSLAAGVLLSYGWHFGSRNVWDRVARFRLPLFIGGGLCFLPFFLAPLEDRWVHTVGFSLLALGSCMILASTMTCPETTNPILRGAAWVGAQSYSIYLWHFPVVFWLLPATRKLIGGRSPWCDFPIALCASVGAGVFAGYLVERPVLRLRDRVIPQPQMAAEEPSGQPPEEPVEQPAEYPAVV